MFRKLSQRESCNCDIVRDGDGHRCVIFRQFPVVRQNFESTKRKTGRRVDNGMTLVVPAAGIPAETTCRKAAAPESPGNQTLPDAVFDRAESILNLSDAFSRCK